MADYTASTLAQLNSALIAIGSGGGKTIDLASGVIATGSIGSNLTFSSPVIVTGAGTLATVLKGWTIMDRCRGIEFHNIDFYRDDSTVNSVVELEGQCDIAMVGCNVHGIYRDPNADWTAGGYTNCVGIRGSNNGGYPLGFRFEDGKIYDCLEGLVTRIAGASGVIVKNSEVYHTYSDTIKITPMLAGLTAPKHFIDVKFHSFVGDPENVDNPHIDLIQFQSVAENDGVEVSNIIARRIIAWEGSGGVGRLIQGVVTFTDGGYTMITRDPIVEGCYFLLAEQHAITFANTIGGTFRNNTIALPSPTYETGYPNAKSQAIIYGSGTITITDNIIDVLDTGGSATFVNSGNVIMGNRGSVYSFASTFDGPTWLPHSASEVVTKFASKVGGPAEGKGASAFAGGLPPDPDPVLPVLSATSITLRISPP